MKAAVRSIYGTSHVLSIQEVETPTPGDEEVLIRVYATTVNRTDCHILTGKPLIMRFITGLFKPRLAITGTDFAGQIEATGKNVTSFKTGDKVMGFDFLGLQSHAHYLTLRDTKEFISIPDNVTYDQAVACVEGAYYALSVINKMNPKAGQQALVNGATGAIGSAAVQLFSFYGVSVAAVCDAEHAALVRSWGADKIIDYKTADFTKDSGRYDFVFDAIGKSSFGQCKRLLKKKGIYSSSGGPNFLRVFITSILGGKKEIFCPPKDLKGCLGFIKTLVEKGRFKPVIDRTYPLDQIAEAFNYVISGQKVGNVVISISNVFVHSS